MLPPGFREVIIRPPLLPRCAVQVLRVTSDPECPFREIPHESARCCSDRVFYNRLFTFLGLGGALGDRSPSHIPLPPFGLRAHQLNLRQPTRICQICFAPIFPYIPTSVLPQYPQISVAPNWSIFPYWAIFPYWSICI